MFLGMGPTELIIILLVVLVIFGPKNLPKLGQALGKTVKNVREGMEEDDTSDKKVEAADDDAVDVTETAEDAGAEDELRYCTKCGAANSSDADFCKKCGSPLE